MPSRDAVAYFGAGPAALPTVVLEQAAQVLLNYKDTGMGITEISHRSPEANAILASAQNALRQLLDIPAGDGPDGYQILFLQGGGSGEFSASVYHMVGIWVERRRLRIVEQLGGEGKASEEEVFKQLKHDVDNKLKIDYLVTGSWSLKASQEAARLVGPEPINVAIDARQAREGNRFGVIPPEKEWKLSTNAEDVAMVYYCDNETVDGVEFPSFPAVLADGARPVVADMSSNFISRKVDVRKYAAIFGGAQKNIGTTGVTLAIVRNDLLPPFISLAKPTLMRRLGLPVGPVVLDWPTIAKNNSLYNTLPIFDVWVAGQVMEGLLQRHASAGIQGQQDESDSKAELLYSTLEKYPELFFVVPDKTARSRMNICFRIGQGEQREAKEKAFLAGAAERGLLGTKGHRSVGGIRISNYNAVTPSSVGKLVQWLNDGSVRTCQAKLTVDTWLLYGDNIVRLEETGGTGGTGWVPAQEPATPVDHLDVSSSDLDGQPVRYLWRGAAYGRHGNQVRDCAMTLDQITWNDLEGRTRTAGSSEIER